MFNYLVKRLLLGVVSMFILIVIVFFLLNLVKGDPLDLANYKDQETYESVRESFGLDLPVIERFFIYIGGIFKGDLGNVYEPSKAGANTIQEIFFGPLKYTIIVTTIAFFLGTIIGICLGFWAGYRAGKMTDVSITIIVIFFVSIPSFVLAAFLIAIGPAIGLPVNFLDWTTYGFGKSLLSMLLPILSLTVVSIGSLTYFIRNEVQAILVSDYILNARSKGLSEWNIFKKYVWRNALIPIVTLVLPFFLILLTGSLVIEQFFGIPGSSTVVVNSVKSNETDIVMFSVIFFGFLGILIRILIDVIYVFIDPRIKYSSATEARNFGLLAAIKRTIDKKKHNKVAKAKIQKVKEEAHG